MTTLLAALALCVSLCAAYLSLVAVQPGGANDPRATATPTSTPVCDSCVPDEEQPTRVWLPEMRTK